MNLSDALDWPSDGNNQSGGAWPSNSNTNASWPGQPGANPTWPGGQPGANPTWPGGQPGANPTWPGGQPGANPTWPGGQPGANPAWPGANPSQPAGPVPVAPQTSLAVPYKQMLPQGIYDKLLITIAGTIKPNAKMITLDFLAGNDLVFHFNPRFNEEGRKVIVRNNCIATKWGKEERELQNFPFVQGQPFEMKILCTNSEFKVAVNNSHLLEFKHRFTNLRAINVLNIYNDLTLSNVQTQTLP